MFAFTGVSGDVYKRQEKHSSLIGFARSAGEYEENKRAGKMSAFLTFEDGRMLEGRQENLDRFYELGYRLITFTWNFDNCLGTACLLYTSERDGRDSQEGS